MPEDMIIMFSKSGVSWCRDHQIISVMRKMQTDSQTAFCFLAKPHTDYDVV